MLLYALGVLDLMLYRHKRTQEIGVRAAGLGLLTLVSAAVAHRFSGSWQPSPPVGSGGYLGALTATFLYNHIGIAGLRLFLMAMGLLGLILCVEELLLWPAREVLALLRRLTTGKIEPTATTEPYVAPYMLPQPTFTVVGAQTMAPLPIGTPPVVPRAVTGTSANVPATRGPIATNDHRGASPAFTIPPAPSGGAYQLPPLELLEPPSASPVQENEAKIHARAMLLERTLLDFGCQVRVVQIDTGPVITQFEIELEAGLRVARIVSLADDLAIALAVPSVRIVRSIPGKTTVGIEVPNERRAMVKLGEVITAVNATSDKKFKIPLHLGKDVKGAALAYDLADMPHLLIAGRTGTGKSVCLNAIILSILMANTPDYVKLILIDPKLVELSQFRRIPHLMHPVVTDMKKAETLLNWACDKMDERYGFLARAGVRNVQAFNQLGPDEVMRRLNPEDAEEAKRLPSYMPYIVIVIDEMGDLIAQVGKEVETQIVRIAQKARAAGIHLIVATQKPTVDVITGLIKSNLPARIAFQVASRNDSRVVLDEMGADKLLGNGDMLFLVPGTSQHVRAQGSYVSDQDVNRVCEYLAQYPVEFSRELVQLQTGGGKGGKEQGSLKDRDELYEAAIEVIVREGRGSTSLLQRALGIGYGRAARLIDYMAEDGIVGEFKSGSAREVLYTLEEWEALKSGGDSATTAA